MSSTELPDLLWRKSSYSNGQANCVEVGTGDRQAGVCVRDSKAPWTPSLTFTARAWQRFTDSVTARDIQVRLSEDRLTDASCWTDQRARGRSARTADLPDGPAN